jgi:hypothetical protein
MGLLRCHQFKNSFFSVFQGNDDGADGLLGLIMALSLIARAATVLLRNKKARAHLIPQHMD